MDNLSIGTAILFWQREFSQPVSLLDEDLRLLYEYKRSLQPPRAAPLLGPIRAEIAAGIAHFRAALRLAVHRPAVH
jgi:hypothetical protein